MRNAILEHMYDNDISNYQHGFLPGRSCTTQLLEVLDKWTEILDNGGVLDVVYLDLAKAFDSTFNNCSLCDRLNSIKKRFACSLWLFVHMKSIVLQGFFHEFAFDNKALKTFVEFRMC